MSAMLKMRCKNCGRVLRTNSENAGKRVRCPKCQTLFVIPNPSEFAGRQSMRAVIEESEHAMHLKNIKNKSIESGFCQVVYTEADPVEFAIRRKNQVPLLDLSQGGLGFLIKASDETATLTLEKIIIIEIDFPILVEPICAKVQVRWVKPMPENNMLQVGVKFYQPDESFNNIINSLIQFIMMRPDVWSIEE